MATWLRVSTDGRAACFLEPIELSSLGEVSVVLGIVLDNVLTLQCTLLGHDDSTLAHVEVVPPTGLDDDDEWVALPGARGHGRVSLAVDVPGFTICLDVATATSSSRSNVLRAVRIVAQKSLPPSTADANGWPAGGEKSHGSVVDASDADALPTIAPSAHGEWLRTQSRPGPPVRCWTWDWLARPEASICALRRDACALVHAHGLGGRTFWIARDHTPRCSLEQLALEVLAFHEGGEGGEGDQGGEGETGGLAEPHAEHSFTGAEFWVQMRAVGGSSLADDSDAASIAFHFDCDEGTFTATGELIPPWLSTITYLADAGAPTLILPARPDSAGEVRCVAPSDEPLGAFVSYPVRGKHVSFDGRLLHGCPHSLSRRSPSIADATPEAEVEAGGGGRRLTFLVNLWRRHSPRGPQRLPSRVATALSGSSIEDGRRDDAADATCASRFLGHRRAADASACAARVFEAHEAAEQQFMPSAHRRTLSPAARTVAVKWLPSVDELGVLSTTLRGAHHLVHVPRAVVV